MNDLSYYIDIYYVVGIIGEMPGICTRELYRYNIITLSGCKVCNTFLVFIENNTRDHFPVTNYW